MHGVFCATKEDALKQALSYIKEGSSVSWGGSMSVSEIGLRSRVPTVAEVMRCFGVILQSCRSFR